MKVTTIIPLAVIGGAGLMVAGAYLGRYLTKRGINVEKLEDKLDTGVQFAERAADAIEPYLPAPYSGLVKTVTSLAAKTVKTTDALNKASMLDADKRKEAATNIIINDMTAAKLPVDNNVRKLISVAIDSACLLLPGHISTQTANDTAQSVQSATTSQEVTASVTTEAK